LTVQPGLLLVDKPAGITSHDVVAKVRRLAGTRKVGHAGTLDPMATGLMLLGIESATKLLTFLVGEDKTYLATMRLGASTVTDDAEGDVLEQAESSQIANLFSRLDDVLEQSLAKLRGQISQRPSAVSAIKVDGQRAYARVRSGEEVVLEARAVTVSRFELLAPPRLVETPEANFIDLDVVVDCSSGTYIRALARDLGSALGVGGHLTSLRRTRVGDFRIEDAPSIEALERDGLSMVPLAQAASARFEVYHLTATEALELRQGKRPVFRPEAMPTLESPIASGKDFAALDEDAKLVAIAQRQGKQLKSTVVFND
jgi:tRNA pseudouridine55 synthase